MQGYQRANINFTTSTTIDNLLASFNTYGALPGPLLLTECSVTYTQNALNNGYWTINASNNPTSGNYTTTLYNLNYSNAATGFTVMKNSGSGWGLPNGTCLPCPVAAVVRSNMNGFSDFGVAQAPTPLPVSWLGVEARATGKTILVSWQTAEEINNDYFSVERSMDGSSFERIDKVDAAGNSNIINSYSINDKNVLTGVLYYYRIKQTDFDGHFDFSKTVSAKINGQDFDFNVQPNPFSSSAVIQYYLEGNADIRIELLNNVGQSLYTVFAGKKEKGLQQHLISNKDFKMAKGIYSVKLTVNGVVFTRLLVKSDY